MMSFTTTVKNEICSLEFSYTENIAELSAFVRSNSKILKDSIELSTENAKVAKRIYLMFKTLYGIDALLEQRKMANFNKKKIFIITISPAQKPLGKKLF